MIIPTQLKVGGHLYKVVRDYKFIERADLDGQADHRNLEIRLSELDGSGQFSRSKIECNFIHELLHCVDNSYNSNKLDEDTVIRLAEGLYQVLKDNDLLKDNN